MLRWIAFDAVGTLIYPEPDVGAAYAGIGQNYGSRLTPGDLRPRFSRVFRESAAACLRGDEGHIVTSEELEVARWRWIVERMLPDASDREACFRELYDHFAQPRHWRLFDDVSATLARLRQYSVRLAIASNFDHRLHHVCRGFSELDVIDRIVVSTDVGAVKPSARFYNGLLQACGCTSEELCMIGDEFEADVAGPEALGIRSWLIDRTGSVSRRSPFTLKSLTDLTCEALTQRSVE